MDPWYQQAIAQSRADMDRRGMLAPPDPRTLPGAVQQQFGLLAGLDRPMLLPQPDRAEGGGPDWSNWTAPEWMYEGAKAVALPGHVMRGGEWSPEDVTNMALTVGGSAGAASMAGGAPRGALGMFGGRMAKTADHDALARAEKMAAGGASRDDIWRETGWFAGPDGKWRFEIDDSGAALRDPFESDDLTQRLISASIDSPNIPVPTAASLDDVLSHAELGRAYPGIPDAGVYFDNMGRTKGRYNTDIDAITLDSGDSVFAPDLQRSTALHELQHAVQSREGFAGGGGHAGPYRDGERGYVIRKNADHRMAPPARSDNPYAAGAFVPDEAEALRSATEWADGPDGRYWLYQRLAGEAEARNVQKRRDYTPEQRRATPPWETLDVPEDELIVRMRSSGTPAGLLIPRQEQVPPWMRPEWGGT